ncbi:hypothetical protein B0T21DRAFT_353586 [Apiosordaria backusii]|uniref:Uncharacterized protein n=1 Tax=Apiosordaria backusii TaxID=314023 RepID=A0AA39ZRT1_9PEZI|nr:hypothetical protein B0T21DRAFT_353586 [Apiosordaria backusii]
MLRASPLPLRCRSGESESGESESGESESGESESGESESGESESGEMEAVGLKALHRTNIQKSAFNCVSLSEVLDRGSSHTFFRVFPALAPPAALAVGNHSSHSEPEFSATAATVSHKLKPRQPQRSQRPRTRQPRRSHPLESIEYEGLNRAYQRYKPLWATEPMEVVGSDKEENEVFNAHKGLLAGLINWPAGVCSVNMKGRSLGTATYWARTKSRSSKEVTTWRLFNACDSNKAMWQPQHFSTHPHTSEFRQPQSRPAAERAS